MQKFLESYVCLPMTYTENFYFWILLQGRYIENNTWVRGNTRFISSDKYLIYLKFSPFSLGVYVSNRRRS
jgi:hypothetical protein